jgi:hypothetical protein
MFKPTDAQKLLNGSYYKRGVQGRIFIHINGGWSLSAITDAQYRLAPETLTNPPKEKNNRERSKFQARYC